MKAADQMKAMVAEYEAHCHVVRTDVPGEEIGADGVVLDIVAKKGAEMIVVEILGRDREFEDDDPAGEREALRRFEVIQKAVEALNRKGRKTEFLIRFFDVSAAQARARTLKKREPIPDDAEIAALTLLAARWTRALRLCGKRYRMSDAHLQTIQSDMYSRTVLTMGPKDYTKVHRSVMALHEGGDVDWDAIRRLGPELERLNAHMCP